MSYWDIKWHSNYCVSDLLTSWTQWPQSKIMHLAYRPDCQSSSEWAWSTFIHPGVHWEASKWLWESLKFTQKEKPNSLILISEYGQLNMSQLLASPIIYDNNIHSNCLILLLFLVGLCFIVYYSKSLKILMKMRMDILINIIL